MDPCIFVAAALAGGVLAVGCGDANPVDDGTSGGVVVAPAPSGARYGYFYGNFVRSGKVFAVPDGGGAPVVLAASPDGRNLGRAVVFDDANVYSSDEPLYEGASPPDGMTSILVLPIAGGAARTLASGLFLVTALAVDGQNVYFVDELTGIVAVPKSGGEVRHLGDVTRGATALAASGGTLYWTNGDTVWRMPVVGGAAEMVATGESGAGAIAADASGVYWVDAGPPNVALDCGPADGSVRFLAPGATAPTTLAQHLAGVDSIALGPGAVSWSGEGVGCNGVLDGSGWIQAISPGDAAPRPVEGGLTIPDRLYVGGSTLYFTTVTDLNANALAPNVVPL